MDKKRSWFLIVFALLATIQHKICSTPLVGLWCCASIVKRIVYDAKPMKYWAQCQLRYSVQSSKNFAIAFCCSLHVWVVQGFVKWQWYWMLQTAGVWMAAQYNTGIQNCAVSWQGQFWCNGWEHGHQSLHFDCSGTDEEEIFIRAYSFRTKAIVLREVTVCPSILNAAGGVRMAPLHRPKIAKNLRDSMKSTATSWNQ